jgi:hypothetical protein
MIPSPGSVVAVRWREDVEARYACRGHRGAVGALFRPQAEGVRAEWEFVPIVVIQETCVPVSLSYRGQPPLRAAQGAGRYGI